MVYTELKNLNRGYMKLDVWQKAIVLFQLIYRTVFREFPIDFKLRSQIIDSAQSVSANIAEGYCRRSIKEYLQILHIALSSLAETLTSRIGLRETKQISQERFTEIDKLRYEIENKLLKLVVRLEGKKDTKSWSGRIKDEG